MERTPLHDALKESQAAFGEVDGWEMPKVFRNIKAEYLAGKGTAAAMDRSHFGRLRLTGAKRLDLLHRISTNDVKSLTDGQGAETILCTEKGRIIDRLLVYAAADHDVVVTSPNMASPIKEAIEKVRFRDDVQIEDVTFKTAMISLFGPEAGRLLEWVARSTVHDLKPHHWKRLQIGSVPVVAARMTACVGGDGFNLICEAAHGGAAWKEIFEQGGSYGLNPMGSEAYEMLRVESGVPSHGRELTDEFNPLEARLDAAVHWSKGCYTGQEVIARLDSRHKVQKLLVGFLVDPGGVPEPRSRVFAGNVEVGIVTSVVPSLEMRRIISLGYVRNEQSQPGTRLEIHSGGTSLGAEVAALPFRPPGAPQPR
jgi:glycine cleavage system T protein